MGTTREWTARGLAWACLLLAAVALEAVFADFYLRRFPLLDHYATPLLDLGKLGGYDPAAGLAMGMALALTGGAHALAWLAARWLGATRAVIGAVVGVSLLFQTTLVLVYPIVAADVFNYWLQGRLMTVHGLNPLLARPADAIGDPWLAFSAWPHIQLAYGPLWVWVSVAVAALSSENLLAGLLGFKVLAVAANLINSALIYRIAERVRPGVGLVALVAYAWSPLVLFETVANAHNDGLLAMPLLLAVWLIARGGRGVVLAPASMVAAALIKYAPVAGLPLVLLGVWQARRRWWEMVAGLALAGGLAVVSWAAFWAGPATLSGVRRQADEVTTSLAAVLIAMAPWQEKDAWLALLRPVAGLVILGVLLWRRPRRSTGVPASIFDLLLVQLLVATFWFQPWYLVPLLALGAASGDRWRQGLGLVFASSASASYLVYFYLWTTPWWGSLSVPHVQLLAATVVYLPPLALLVARGMMGQMLRLKGGWRLLGNG